MHSTYSIAATYTHASEENTRRKTNFFFFTIIGTVLSRIARKLLLIKVPVPKVKFFYTI